MSTHKLNKAEFTERVQRKNQYHLAWSLPNLFGAYIKWGLFAAFSYQSGIKWHLFATFDQVSFQTVDL
jgi:hypothetical protein|tara:strand:- start:1550 stop:1753 length:204 start_codon:yes stop_codon:yes gene_type:complete